MQTKRLFTKDYNHLTVHLPKELLDAIAKVTAGSLAKDMLGDTYVQLSATTYDNEVLDSIIHKQLPDMEEYDSNFGLAQDMIDIGVNLWSQPKGYFEPLHIAFLEGANDASSDDMTFMHYVLLLIQSPVFMQCAYAVAGLKPMFSKEMVAVEVYEYLESDEPCINTAEIYNVLDTMESLGVLTCSDGKYVMNYIDVLPRALQLSYTAFAEYFDSCIVAEKLLAPFI